jgi:glycosyltransferase involved in cell wall biosynthesis
MNNIQKYIIAYRNKITNKLSGVVFVKCQGEKKGNVLFSYVTQPFTLAPGEFLTDPHSNNWVAPEIARIFSERGYDVDVINWDNVKFVPRKKYTVCIDLCNNLENLASHLNPDCKKVMFIIGGHPEFQNTVENERIRALEKRRGIAMPPKRNVPNINDGKYVDFIAGYGNEAVHGTFSSFGKKVFPIPGPTMETYDFPEDKDFSLARKHFLWFGGGGAILKGLDLVIEAFAELPHLKLTIIGPASYEKEFEKIYEKELKLPNITRYERPRLNGKDPLSKADGRYVRDILKECGAVLGMSASEGGGAATVQAMQAGVFPIVTPNTGIIDGVPCITMENPTVEKIIKTVEEFSNTSPEKLKELSREVWAFSQKHYTKEAFTKSFEDFTDNVLQMPK